ncbi:unnamed protein product [Spodoptera littoralis]|uniref:Uncharacterized protein n=1 Tax=Spodoptera littoralis TaxID=7109 RepID=A0A9N8KZE7_SPOLI|nr:unnamed protein product [Spodoptera littoralis]CAD0226087.1 unnamed protein product [Spodoptera littoralis]
MVMATGSVYQQVGGPAHEEPRCGVWVEHSYARARGAAAGPTHSVRVLLAPRPAADAAPLDVERLEPAPPDLPDDDEALRLLADDDADSEPDDDWEARVMAAAPTTAHARLADAVLDILRRARLELLAGGRAGEALRTAARRLRLALAAPPMAAAPPRPPPGCRRSCPAGRGDSRHGQPRAGGDRRRAERGGRQRGRGRSERAVAAVGELRPRAPRPALAAPTGGAAAHAPGGGGRGGRRGRGGRGADARGVVRRGGGGLRAALSAALGAAGERPVVLGGAGAGATLAAGLAGGTRARALVLLAPALVTAEGAREAAEEARVPTLVVSGAGGAQCWRGAAREMSRRVLELRGADDWLRLPARARRRRRLPQDAVDAAVADECARWILDVALGAGGGAPGGAGVGARRREGRGLLRALGPAAAPDDDEDFAHLPTIQIKFRLHSCAHHLMCT